MHTSRISLIGHLMASTMAILLILFLLWLEIIPGGSLRDAQYNVEAGFQRERSRLFVNSAYTLRYRPVTGGVRAIRDLEIALPAFQKEQAFLWTNPDPDVQRLLSRAQPEYLSFVATVSTILARPDDVITSTEFLTVLSDDQLFFTPMNTLVTVLNQHAQEEDSQLLFAKLIVMSLCLLIICSILIFDGICKSRDRLNSQKKAM
jgi:hypothetical protein